MNKVKLKVPVNSFISAQVQIANGADEIYLGMFSPDWFQNLSFSHRGRTNLSSDKNRCITTTDDLKKIVEYAHQYNVTVSFTANFFNLPDTKINPELGKTLHEGYIDYVSAAIECGVDSIIVATLSEILLLRENFPDVKIVASCLLMISNVYYIKYLMSLGVYSFFLPHDTSIEEVKAIRALSNDIEIGVFAHFSCAMLSGGCHLYHKFGESVNLGYPCRNCYSSKMPDGLVEKGFIFDSNCDCSICQVEELIKAGVSSFKIIGRSSSYRMTSKFAKLYKDIIDSVVSGGSWRDVRKDFIAKETWWKEVYCDNHMCKYSRNGKFKDQLIG